MIHLSKSAKTTPEDATLIRERASSPVARPAQPTLSDEVRGREETRRPRSAASRAGEPPCQPPRMSAAAPEPADTPGREGQRSPDPVTRISSAPPTNPKTSRTPPHPPVDRGAPSVKVGIGGAGRRVNSKIRRSAEMPATAREIALWRHRKRGVLSRHGRRIPIRVYDRSGGAPISVVGPSTHRRAQACACSRGRRLPWRKPICVPNEFSDRSARKSVCRSHAPGEGGWTPPHQGEAI